ncbi:hypothetical protein K438DRAFT_1995668, partial [Mycena galopus ATCC 62051]
MTSHMTPNGNCCPHCNNQLTVKVSGASGEIPGSSFIRCPNPHGTKGVYFHRFPFAGTTTSNQLPAPAPSTPAGPFPPAAAPACRKHCNETGYCTLRAHERERQRKRTKAAPAASAPGQSFTSVDYASHDDWVDHTLPPIRALDAYQQKQDASFSWLDNLPGVKSPMPETESVHEQYEREEREDAAQLELRLQLSRAEGTGSTSRVPSAQLRLPHSIVQAGNARSSSSPSSSTSGPRPLSASPQFPINLLTAVPPTKKSTVPLCLTRQLNSDWESVGTSKTAPTTFHVKKKAPTESKRFILVFWSGINLPHRVLFVEHADIPSWPKWHVSDATPTLASMLGTDLDVWLPKFKNWAAITPSSPHVVSSESVVMLRRRDLDCYDFEATMHLFYPENTVIHMRQNLPGERAALRGRYKPLKNKILQSSVADSDSDVEVIDSVHKSKRIKEEDSDDLPP